TAWESAGTAARNSIVAVSAPAAADGTTAAVRGDDNCRLLRTAKPRPRVTKTAGGPATLDWVASVLSVNLARVRTNPDPRAQSKSTGIDKVAAPEAVMVR